MTFQITDIQAQKKRDGYYSIFIDEEYSFSLSELDLSSSGLRIGASLGQEELERLKKLSLASKAYNRGVYYLRYGPRTVSQMRQYLKTKGGFEDEEIDSAILRLENELYLNDEAYIDSYLNARQISRPRSKRHLAGELRKKGVASSLIDEKLSEIDEDSQRTAVLQIAQKKLALSRFQNRQKLTEYLVRQGFPYGLVKQVLSELDLDTSPSSQTDSSLSS